MSKVVHQGWLVRFGRRKIGRSFIRLRYFVLESRLLAYYKRQPKDNMLPSKTLVIDGNCRVEDRGLKTHHGHMVYVLCVYNKKDKHHQITMGAYTIQDAMTWKEKIELVIDQQQDSLTAKHRKAFASCDFDMDNVGNMSFSDHESPPEDEEVNQPTLLRRTTIGNGLRIFEELLEVDYLRRSYTRAMKAVGVVDAKCEAIFGLVMSMDGTRFEWDCSFHYGSLVEEVDGHTAILYHRLQLDWLPIEHPNCGPQPGFVRAHIESGGFKISPLKSRNGRPRTQVQHLMQIDLKGWGINYFPSFQQHCLLQMLNSVAGLREYFAQTDDINAVPRIPVMLNMTTDSVSLKKDHKPQEGDSLTTSLDQARADNRTSVMLDEESDEDDDYQIPEANSDDVSAKAETDAKQTVPEEELEDQIDLSSFSGNLRRDDDDKSRNCWRVPDGKLFKVRSKNFPNDKSKITAGKFLMELVAVDWLKDSKRMDHVARRQGCAAQVASEKGLFCFVVNLQIPGSTHYSMVFYFVTRHLRPGSLLQRFVDGDDDFRNSRFKLIPSVSKGSWIVRQSVGSTPCLLGKAVDSTYIRGAKYLEIDVDIGSSAVANGVLGLVCGVVTTLVVDMAFLVQANTSDELPEQLIGAIRLSHIELSSAVVPDLGNNSSTDISYHKIRR
ncbi:Protein ENHANCED DISEASE RESISTANCE 2-like, partial [Ananas comosus]